MRQLCLLVLFSFLLLSCVGPDPDPIPTGDYDTAIIDKDTIQPDIDTYIPDTVDIDSLQPDNDVVGGCEDANIGTNCKMDVECGACLICVNAKCSAGCQSDTDCSSYPNTVCNKSIYRCINKFATECDETHCIAGCCYGDKGFQNLKCLPSPVLSTCGICKQGEVYMDGKQCVPATCKVGETKCQTYNSTDLDAECFECKATDLVCSEKTPCNTGSALLTLNVMSCIPAGGECSDGDNCCSSMPCIKGYCY